MNRKITEDSDDFSSPKQTRVPEMKKRHSDKPVPTDRGENDLRLKKKKMEKLSLSPGKNKRANNYSEFGTGTYYGNFNLRV